MRIDIYIHHEPHVPHSLKNIEAMLKSVLFKEEAQMAIGQEILDAVTAQGTLIGSVKTLIEGLVANGTIPAEVGEAIKAKLAENSASLEAALAAGVPPTP